ncbi:B12-binding domain-containing radical SAM protein [Candidatus Aerophobetes bacterium]|uniref:B12-binding domain-containing radical SAM protein n=1 Tax=Aerophobetes bacterium TaxID=2030807 RepID=A0A523YKK5_UNCAE|nr:MAG: B12-binding domain-containing radical SAM protein [Candidatus Aerophobetes bacterium]
MKLKLIYPSSRKANPELQWWKQPKAHRYPGLGLLTVAALCPPTVEIKLVDDDHEEINYEEDTDLVGLSLLTINSQRAYEIARNFRDRRVPVVLGGMHVVACSEEALKHADSIVVGEAEDTWPELLRDFNSGKLKRIYKSSCSSDLSNMPLPRRDLVDKRRYITINTIQATRGCPFDCEFCSMAALFGQKTRLRPVEEVIEEIKSLEGNIFVLNDDNLAQKSEYYKNLFYKLIPLKKRWAANASWNIAEDEETLVLLEKSGCRGVFVGFESLEPQYGVKKIISSKDRALIYKEAVKKLHAHRINVIGAFIFGFDNEDESIFERTLEFAFDSQIDAAQINILTPYPGTPLYRRLDEEGRITERNWNKYIASNLCFKLKTMSERTFLEKYHWMKSKFHTFPRIALRLLRASRISAPYELWVLLGINLGIRKSIKDYSREFESSS